MRVLAAPDKFRGTATAAEVAAAIAGAARDAGHVAVETPLADGGEGTLAALGGPNRSSLVTGPLETIRENYRLALGKVERVLGQDCQWIHLDPKDALRYAQRLCAEVGSGLLLRAKTLGPRQQVLELYAFTNLRTGREVSRGEVKSTFLPQSRGWRRDVQPIEEPKSGSAGWSVASPPSGFRLVGEMQRLLPNRPHPVTQLVLSDGIATMSVFVEPASGPPQTSEATSADGALSVFLRPMGEHVVTVLGEVPPAAAQQVGRGVGRQVDAVIAPAK